MKNIKLGSKGPDVLFLQAHLGLVPDGNFGPLTDSKVKEYQTSKGLVPDGQVGPKTWSTFSAPSLVEQDFTDLAKELKVDVPALKAVWSVESGGAGFYKNSIRPKILFEGHVFWNELKKRGINPESLKSKYPNIIYPSWTKAHYVGGEKEYDRLEQAWSINPEAAMASASAGMFQIMGNNWILTGSKGVLDYWAKSCLGEKHQLEQFGKFIVKAGIIQHLIKHDWETVALKYNGKYYYKNKYSEKLRAAYVRFSK